MINSERNGVTVRFGRFDPKIDLFGNVGYDFVKIDIEGYEESLLESPDLAVPAVVEVHGRQLADKFEQKGWRVVRQGSEYGDLTSCTAYAYWRC